MGDHDGLFKRAFSVPAHAAGELRSVLPEALTNRLDLSTLKLETASFVDAEMEHRHADLLFSATLAAAGASYSCCSSTSPNPTRSCHGGF
jgi:predicted transposase YdaD